MTDWARLILQVTTRKVNFISRVEFFVDIALVDANQHL